MATSVGNGMRNHVSPPPVSACARAACTRPCQDFYMRGRSLHLPCMPYAGVVPQRPHPHATK